MTVAMITMYTGLTLNRDIEKGVYDRFRSLPVWRPATLVGPLLADAVRYVLAATIILGLGLAGLPSRGGGGGVVAAWLLLLVFAFSLSWVWTLLGLVMRSENALMGASMMILFPLTFVSNVFVPTGDAAGMAGGVRGRQPRSRSSPPRCAGLMHGHRSVARSSSSWRSAPASWPCSGR
jgi:ABC-2 type transport system permease protein